MDIIGHVSPVCFLAAGKASVAQLTCTVTMSILQKALFKNFVEAFIPMRLPNKKHNMIDFMCSCDLAGQKLICYGISDTRPGYQSMRKFKLGEE